ncbi:MAG: hypothetical protein OHK0022_15270 [Roseiflexaceae bacterium]
MYTDAPSNENVPSGSSSSQGMGLSVELVDAQGNVRQAVPLNERGVTIGSAPGNVLVIDSPAVARFHVRINWDGQYASILNLATRKPTLFGGGPLQANELRFWQPGEVLQIGDSRLRLQVGASAPSQQQNNTDAPVTMPLGALPAVVNDGHLEIHLDTGYEMIDLTPEQPTMVKLTLINRGSTPETVTVGIDGPGATWLRTPQAPLQIKPGAQVSHALQIVVPRKPENRAGEYEVLIRMRSQNGSGLSVTTTGHWTVLPYSDAKLEVRPPILKVRSMNSGIYTVSLRNQGNASMPFEVRISDDQQSLEFAPITASGVLEPGAIDERKIEVQPIREPDDKEQTYNVRVQAFANGQTYTDNATLLQRRTLVPQWVIPLAISGLVLLLVAGAALWTRQARANQNNQNATQIAAITQTIENMRLTDSERNGTALAASTQTPLAMTIQAINSNGLMGPTATILSQMNGTQIAAAAQITAQAAMIRTVQAAGGNTTNNNNFFGGPGSGASANDPRVATLEAGLATAQAVANQVTGAQTSSAQQSQAGQAQQQAGQTSQAVSQATQGAQSTQSAASNTQGTQAAAQQTSQANAQNTAAAQTAKAEGTSAAFASQTAIARQTETAAAQQTSVAQQTANAVQQLTAIAQQTANASATTAAMTQQAIQTSTASAVAAIQTATAIAQPNSLRITNSNIDKDATETFNVTVQVLDGQGNKANTTNPVISLRLEGLDSAALITAPSLSLNPSNGEVTFTNLQIKRAGVYRLFAAAPDNSTMPQKESNRITITISPGPASKLTFLCYLYGDQTTCPNPSNSYLKTVEKWGFVGEVQDTFGNRVNYDGSASGKYNFDKKPSSNEKPITGDLDIVDGTLTYAQSDFPNNTGTGKFFISVQVNNAGSISRLTGPLIDLFPGDPDSVVLVSPNTSVSPANLRPNGPGNQDRTVTFEVRVRDAKQNDLSSGNVCFITKQDNSIPTGTFRLSNSFRSTVDGASSQINNQAALSPPVSPGNGPNDVEYRLYAVATNECNPATVFSAANFEPSEPYAYFRVINRAN